MGGDHIMNAPNRAEILELIQVKVAVMSWSDIDPATITESTLIADCVYDSLDVVEFTCELEVLFDIDISDEEISKLTTIGSAVDLVERKLKS